MPIDGAFPVAYQSPPVTPASTPTQPSPLPSGDSTQPTQSGAVSPPSPQTPQTQPASAEAQAQQLEREQLARIDQAIESHVGASRAAGALLNAYRQSDARLDHFERSHVVQVLAHDLQKSNPAAYRAFIQAISEPARGLGINLSLKELDATPGQFNPAYQDKHVAELAYRSILKDFQQGQATHGGPAGTTSGTPASTSATGSPIATTTQTPQEGGQPAATGDTTTSTSTGSAATPTASQLLDVLRQMASSAPDQVTTLIDQVAQAAGVTDRGVIDAVKAFITRGSQAEVQALPPAKQTQAAQLLDTALKQVATQLQGQSQPQSAPTGTAPTTDPSEQPEAPVVSPTAPTQPTDTEPPITSPTNPDPSGRTATAASGSLAALRSSFVADPQGVERIVSQAVDAVLGGRSGTGDVGAGSLLRTVIDVLRGADLPVAPPLRQAVEQVIAHTVQSLSNSRGESRTSAGNGDRPSSTQQPAALQASSQVAQARTQRLFA